MAGIAHGERTKNIQNERARFTFWFLRAFCKDLISDMNSLQSQCFEKDFRLRVSNLNG